MNELKIIELGCSMKEESKGIPFHILPIYYLDRFLRFISTLSISIAMSLYKIWHSKRKTV